VLGFDGGFPAQKKVQAMISGETLDGTAQDEDIVVGDEQPQDVPPKSQPQANGLLMCLQRLARLQNTPVDAIDLQEAVARLEKGELTPRKLRKGIRVLTDRLGSPKAEWVKQPEPSNMPLLGWSAEEGFSVLRGQNAVGLWVMEVWIPDEQVWLERVVDSLEGSLYVKISLAKIFQASQSPVYGLIRSEVFSHKKILMEIILAGFVVNTVALATSFYTMLVYDRVVPTGALSTLWVLTIGAGISIGYELLTKAVRHRLYNRLINVVDQRLARSTFMQFLSVRLDQLPSSVGSFASQLRGYETVRNFLSSATSHIFVDAPFAFLYAGIIAAIAGPLALIPISMFLLCLIIGLSYKKRVEALTSNVDKAVNLKTGLLVEAVEGAETIKSGQGGWRLLSRWMQTTDDARIHEMHHRDIAENSKLLLGSLQQVSYVGIIFFGAQMASAGELTLGALIACSILSGRILAPVVMVPGLLIQWGQSKAALKGLDALWALQNDHDGQQPIAPERIQGNFVFEDVAASYKDNLAIQVPTLRVRAGEKIGILGPVGAGKTTLLRLLSGMYKPQEGRVLLDGIDLGQVSKPVLAENMGFVQQDGRLFSGTLRENLTLGLLDPGDSVLLDVAKTTGLLQMVITPHPKGLMQEINEGGTGLSGGQRQLVNLTRAFLRNPKIWLLDEPTASMDRSLEQTIIHALKNRLGPEQTLFMVTHKPDLLELVDRLIVIAGKKIVADGPKAAVLAQLAGNSAANAQASQGLQQSASNGGDAQTQENPDE
jgi:ATP-binding cassette subfamily C protein LapB